MNAAVHVTSPPRHSERAPYVVTCDDHPDYRETHYFPRDAWIAADDHSRTHPAPVRSDAALLDEAIANARRLPNLSDGVR